MTMDVAEAGGVLQAGGEVLFLQAGEGIEDVIETVPGTEMGKNGSHRNACPLDNGLSVADIRMSFDAVHARMMGGKYGFVKEFVRRSKIEAQTSNAALVPTT